MISQRSQPTAVDCLNTISPIPVSRTKITSRLSTATRMNEQIAPTLINQRRNIPSSLLNPTRETRTEFLRLKREKISPVGSGAEQKDLTSLQALIDVNTQMENKNVIYDAHPWKKGATMNKARYSYSTPQQNPDVSSIAPLESRNLPLVLSAPATRRPAYILHDTLAGPFYTDFTNKRKTPDREDDGAQRERWSSKRLRSRKLLVEGTESFLTNVTAQTAQIDSEGSSIFSHNEEEELDLQDEGEHYEVEKIIGEATGEGRHEYLVQWVGYQELDWIPAEDCFCPEKIAEFRKVPRMKVLVAQLMSENAGTEKLSSVPLSSKNKLNKPNVKAPQLPCLGKVQNLEGEFINHQVTKISQNSSGGVAISSTNRGQASEIFLPIVSKSSYVRKDGLQKGGAGWTMGSDKNFRAPDQEASIGSLSEGSIGYAPNERSYPAILSRRESRGLAPAIWLNCTKEVGDPEIHIRSGSVIQKQATQSLSNIMDPARTSSELESACLDAWVTEAAEMTRPGAEDEVKETKMQGEFEEESERIQKQLAEEERTHQAKVVEARRRIEEEDRRPEEKLTTNPLLQEQTKAKSRMEEVQRQRLDLLEMFEQVEEQRKDSCRCPHSNNWTPELTMGSQHQRRCRFAHVVTVIKDEVMEEAKKRERIERRKLERRLINASAEKFFQELGSVVSLPTLSRGGQALRKAREKEKRLGGKGDMNVRPEFVGEMSQKRAKRLIRLGNGETVLPSVEI
jgi:hypothetical protein